MKEEFLYYLWTFQLFKDKLVTMEDEAVEVLNPGLRNTDSGPDFMQALLRIGTTVWAGSVEIHVRASDWYRHGHQDDLAYNSVILHVVYEADRNVTRTRGEALPVVQVKDKFEEFLYQRYSDFLSSRLWVACAGQLHNIPVSLQSTYLNACAVERFEKRCTLIDHILQASKGDLEETMHRFFARAFGGGLNSDAFENLAMILPFRLCRQYHDEPQVLEALALGQAGFLKPGFQDAYPASLWLEYLYYKNKHDLNSMSSSYWKFSKIRPGSFPTIRVIQWMTFLRNLHSLVDEVVLENASAKLMNHLQQELHPYWAEHLIPDRPASKGNRICGESFCRVWITNAVVPMMIYYGRTKDRQERIDAGLAMLEGFPPEQNKILSAWDTLGLKAANALEGQGLIQLKKNYCDQKKCLSCSFGNLLIRKTDN